MGIVAVGRHVEGGSLNKYCYCPTDSDLVMSSNGFPLCHVDANTLSAFTTKDHAQNWLPAVPDCLAHLGPNYLHRKKLQSWCAASLQLNVRQQMSSSASRTERLWSALLSLIWSDARQIRELMICKEGRYEEALHQTNALRRENTDRTHCSGCDFWGHTRPVISNQRHFIVVPDVKPKAARQWLGSLAASEPSAPLDISAQPDLPLSS